MRIVVSGTHASGKSTLISDFAARHPEYSVLPDPFELMDEFWDAPGPAMFAAQLRLAADRLSNGEHGSHLIAERGPLDFLAYLSALETLDEAPVSPHLWDRATGIVRDSLRLVDLVVVLPLVGSDALVAGADEHLALREAMNDALLDLIDDHDVVDERARVVEITGDRGRRLAALEAAVAGSTPQRVS